MADYLIETAINELEYCMPQGYSNFLKEDLERATIVDFEK